MNAIRLMRPFFTILLLSCAACAQDQVRAVAPGASANRFYSPGVDAGDYVYISGQGPRRPNGSSPEGFNAQVKQAFDNIKSIVEAARLTIDHVVYIQVYLDKISNYDEMNKIFAEYFGKTPPARAVLGVARLPESPIQINAVAVRNTAEKKPVFPLNYKSSDPAPAGMLTHDRLFVSSMPGSEPANGKIPEDPGAQVDLALDRVQAVRGRPPWPRARLERHSDPGMGPVGVSPADA